jgi:rubrerythrin
MVTGKEDLLQSLIEAFLMEKGTQIFYSEASRKAADDDLKNTFRELAGLEEKHMEYIQSLYLSLQDDRDWQKFEEFGEKTVSPVTEGGMPIKDLEARVEKYVFMDDGEALALALEIEGKSYNLYRRLSERAADSNARVVFHEMMEQEVKHIEYLKEMKKRLAETP